MSNFVVSVIELDGCYKKNVYITHTQTGESFRMKFGGGVSDKYIRYMAPHLVEKGGVKLDV
ncbi:hypothetical protein [Marinicrinis sediminis]|uniref:Uncharacterized protein n=1 Tax=Marinicrinis sediminis TaxID=1652465 RepID=A0ABW5REG6_9BACL